MATTFIGLTSSTFSTTVTVTTHQVGDLLLIIHIRTSAGVSVPAGWTAISTDAPVQNSFGTTDGYVTIAYKIATATNDASGTWSGASGMDCLVYRQNTAGPPTLSTTSGSASAGNWPYPDLSGHSAYLRVARPGSTSTPSGWTSRSGAGIGSCHDALAASGAASAVGSNNATYISNTYYRFWTIGLSPVATSSGNFFAFF